VAAPVTNEVVVVDTADGSRHSVFRVQTPAQRGIVAEVLRPVEVGEPCLELLTPEVWDPLPGFVTGMIVGTSDGSVYVTTLGDSVVRLDLAGPTSRAKRMTRSELDAFATRYAAPPGAARNPKSWPPSTPRTGPSP
jgi:hypothetical protein